jgi:23S rRNA (guanosine2251-2'-O)-methyltransferase
MNSESEYCIYGRKPILDALTDRQQIEKIMVLKSGSGEEITAITALARGANIQVQYVPKEKLDAVVRKYARFRDPNHQGVVAFLSLVSYYTVEEVMEKIEREKQQPLLVVLDGVTDVHNLGAIARSAECMGAQAIIVPASGSAQMNPEAIKASAGALLKLMVCREQSISSTAKLLKAHGLQLLAAEANKSQRVSDVDFKKPTAIILGDEGEGVSDAVLKLCDATISIPMKGETESLNVSVSAGVILYEAMKQRLG